MKNNIFTFATKELSQDAVICWCVNWFNVAAKGSPLYEMAVDILKLFVNPNEASEIENEDKIIIHQQVCKADVIIYLPKAHILIIVEDKVYSSEHGDQIKKYVEAISDLTDDEKNALELNGMDKNKIETVYFKTGFFYDNDVLVQANHKVDGKAFLKIIEKYQDEHVLLEMYYAHLTNLLKWYDEHENFDKALGDNHWSWDVSKQQFTQYKLMRAIFPKEMWKGEINKSEATGNWCRYYIYSSSSSGRPWTEINVFRDKLFTDTQNETHEYCIFWRIDSDRKGVYISLRFYDRYNKKDDISKKQHADKFKELSEDIKRIATEHKLEENKNISLKTISTYNEATLLHYNINDVLKDWKNSKEGFIQCIRTITDEFIKVLEEKSC